MTTYRRKELRTAWGLFMVIGLLFDSFVPMAFVHEFGHVIGAVIAGVRVYRITPTAVYTDWHDSALLSYMGPWFAMAVWLTLTVVLLYKRRSLVIPAALYGRAIAEWLVWWISSDRKIAYLSPGPASIADGFHVVVMLPVIIAVAIVARALITQWNVEAPRHIENPSLFKQGEMSAFRRQIRPQVPPVPNRRPQGVASFPHNRQDTAAYGPSDGPSRLSGRQPN